MPSLFGCGGEVMMTDPACPHFKPSATAAWVCSHWIMPDTHRRAVTQFMPFCKLDHDCPNNGQRNLPVDPEAEWKEQRKKKADKIIALVKQHSRGEKGEVEE
jgi:hypothetical protein